MKRRILSITVLVALFAALAAQAMPVRATPYEKLKPCSIYEVLSYREAHYGTQLNVGNFSAVTVFADPLGKTAGQTTWVKLGINEINFIKAINVSSYKNWQWADGPVGTIYLGTDNEELDVTVRWPRIVLSSNESGLHRNQACVMERSQDGRFAHIQGIPKDTDYTKYEAFPWLFNTAYTVYPLAPGELYNRTGYLALYKMPLWEPSSGFPIAVGGGTGMWLPVQFLGPKLGEFDPNAATPTMPPTETPLPPTPAPSPAPQIAFEMRVLDRNGKLLSVRNEPSMSSLSIGGLYPNAIIYVEDLRYGDELDPESIWGQLGDHAWIAICFNQTLYTNFGCAPVR